MLGKTNSYLVICFSYLILFLYGMCFYLSMRFVCVMRVGFCLEIHDRMEFVVKDEIKFAVSCCVSVRE